ncbi:MAG: hypothetical protein ABIZ57_00770 [Candidatus Limnocylindria bacterium]
MSRSLIPHRLVAWILASITVLTAGCVTENLPAACDEPSITLELELTADSLTPGAPAVCRDQEVTLVIASEVDGIIHLHGYDTEVPATEVSAGNELRLTFTAERSGQFPIELHPATDPTAVNVGVFTVYEP